MVAALAAPEGDRGPAAPARVRHALDLAGTSLPPTEGLRSRRIDLQQRLALARGADRLDARLMLVRLLLAQGQGQEAAAMLGQLGGVTDPTLAALNGVAAILRDEPQMASGLDRPELDGDPEIAPWRAARDALNRDFSAAVARFVAAPALPDRYPPALVLKLALAEAQSRLALGQPREALIVTGRLGNRQFPGWQLARLRLLEAAASEALAQHERADAAWTAAEALGDPGTRAAARWGRTIAAVRAGRLQSAEGARRLARDRSYWRELPDEAQMLADLGRLRLAAADPVGGITAMGEAVAHAADPAIAEALRKEAKEQVARALIGDNSSQPASALTALLIYRGFPALLPEGAALAELERRLAVRLADAGLDLPAHALLDRRIGLGGSAEARAEAAAAIAAGRLAEQRPEAALVTLKASGPQERLGSELSSRLGRLTWQAKVAIGERVSADPSFGDTPEASGVALALALRQRDWPGLERAASAMLDAGRHDQRGIAVASLALAQAHRPRTDGSAASGSRKPESQPPDDEAADLMATLEGPTGATPGPAAALASEALWLRALRDYLGHLGATRSAR